MTTPAPIKTLRTLLEEAEEDLARVAADAASDIALGRTAQARVDAMQRRVNDLRAALHALVAVQPEPAEPETADGDEPEPEPEATDGDEPETADED